LLGAVVPLDDRNELLAEGIPALSAAAGIVKPSSLPNVENRNSDMNIAFKPDGGAWGRSGEPYATRWLHCDIREMAFYYTQKLFVKLVKEGDL
jgi:hypothetical protein